MAREQVRGVPTRRCEVGRRESTGSGPFPNTSIRFLPWSLPAITALTPPLAAHYHYLSVTAASGGHRKGQETFVQRISSNISEGKYISPVLNGARRGKWAGSRARAPCSSLHLVHLSPRRLPQHRATQGDTHFTPPVLLLMLVKWMT